MLNLDRKPETERRIAMLIDGDNAQVSLLEPMLEEISRYGTITIRRAYGDWTQPDLAKWRKEMLAHAIQPIQQWRYTVGKNATDSALIIDAMDILYSNTVHGFCIVSSDSDYTRLGTRIRESGLFVMGMGRKQTAQAFVRACDVFVFVENLQQDEFSPLVPDDTPDTPPEIAKPASDSATPKTRRGKSSAAKTAAAKAAAAKAAAKKPVKDDDTSLLSLLHRAFNIAVQDDGWAHLGSLGQALHRIDPSFDSRTYGHKTLSLLVKSLPKAFVVKGERGDSPSAIYVRLEEES